MKNSKVVSFLSPFKVGQAGNLWTLPRIPKPLNKVVLDRYIHSIYVNKTPIDATVCRYLFTAKLLYMFRVSQHP